MRKLRNKLAQYQEIFYMLFLLPMTGMTSMGLNSEDRIYLYVFAVATLFLLLKMLVTDFTWKEIVIMGIFTLLLGANFLRNGEKTLILTAMGIFGAKNVNLDKVMKYALWEKAVLTVGTLTLAAVGVIENEFVVLSKNSVIVELPCYGYYQPNMAFANIFVILLLAVIVYGDRLKWYAYIVGTVIILGSYKVFMCRTGLAVWFVLCLVVVGYRLTKCIGVQKKYMSIFVVVPMVMTLVTMILPVSIRNNKDMEFWLSKILTGRIGLISAKYDDIWSLGLGHIPQHSFDNMYFQLLYNYGWIIFIFCIVLYIIEMWYCNRKCQYYITIALGIMAIYGFMELLPLSALWNLPLLYLSQVLFRGEKKTHEQLQ